MKETQQYVNGTSVSNCLKGMQLSKVENHPTPFMTKNLQRIRLMTSSINLQLLASSSFGVCRRKCIVR